MANPVKPLTSSQRTYGKGRRVGTKTGRVQGATAAGAAGLTIAAIQGMSQAQLKRELKKAQEGEHSARIKAAIEKELRKLAQEKQTMKGNNTRGTSPKPRLRPQEKAKGGAVKKTKMMRGGYAKKKK